MTDSGVSDGPRQQEFLHNQQVQRRSTARPHRQAAPPGRTAVGRLAHPGSGISKLSTVPYEHAKLYTCSFHSTTTSHKLLPTTLQRSFTPQNHSRYVVIPALTPQNNARTSRPPNLEDSRAVLGKEWELSMQAEEQRTPAEPKLDNNLRSHIANNGQARGSTVAADSFNEASVAIAVDPVALITTECITVTSAMRKHARWSHSSVSAILGGPSPRKAAFRDSKAESALRRRANGSQPIDVVPSDDDEGLASRWGLRGKKGKSLQDNPLMSAFARLRSDLRGCTDIHTFDIPSLLHPFLQVIRSSSTSAPITSLALVAITKFFAYNLISRESPRLSLGMQLLSAAITHCRFEASDSAADEIVLLRILKLMEDMLSGPGGDLLGDESVCEMMETGLSMCCQMRLSELLRRSAEMSMIAMCQIVFERLKHLEDAAGGDPIEFEEDADQKAPQGPRMDAPLSGSNAASQQPSSTESVALGLGDRSLLDNARLSQSSRPSSSSDQESRVLEGATELAPATAQGDPDSSDEVQPIKPYSLPSIRELFRVLVNLLDPHDRQHTDAMRIMALRIIDVALEVAGPSIARHPSLASLAKDSLCRNLFQLVKSDNMNLLNESLRVTGTLLSTCRSVLKMQQELFLSYLVGCLHPQVEIPLEQGIDPRLYDGVPQAPKLVKKAAASTNSGRSTPVPVKDRQKLGLEGGSRKPDAREAMVESIAALARIPSFLVELFINYDSDVDRGDLCEDLIGLLSRNAFPDSATWSTTNVPPLCLDALLSYVQFMADRLDQAGVEVDLPDRTLLRQRRSLKGIIVKGAAKFNESPKGGVAYLASQGVIQNADSPESIVKFLRGTSRISKKVLGDFISKKNNEQYLAAFIDLFDFSGKRVDEALRDMLGAFRLPGESPLIERIVVVFSDKYFARSGSSDVADQDTVYVLTYAIIMLNTDQHNPNVKGQNRMTFEAFSRNLRGVNGGKDFDQTYLQNIFESIRTNEIILPDEHDNKHAFDYAWKELLLKAETADDYHLPCTSHFDADMFESTWKPVVATLSYVFMTASEDAVYQRVITGFYQCAQIAARYKLTEALDHIIFCLAKITKLAPEIPPNTALNTEVQSDKKNIMVSELAVKFGRDYRAQLATIVLFKGVIFGNEACIRNGWKHIVPIWINLFTNSLVPSMFADLQESMDLPPIPIQSPTHVVSRDDRGSGPGLFQSFTSYLSSYAADDPPEPSEDELNDTLCTVDCVNACPMEEITKNLMSLSQPALISLIHALLGQLPQDTSPVVAVVKPEPGSPNPAKGLDKSNAASTIYSPSIVYTLEGASMLIINNPEAPTAIVKELAEALQDTVRNASNLHPIIVSRATFYLLKLLSSSHEQAIVRAPVVLHTISSLNQSTTTHAAVSIVKGLSLCLHGARTLRNEIVNTPDFWSLIRELRKMEDAASGVFDLIISIMDDTPSAITADNYEAAILVLNDYATAGSIGAVVEQRRERSSRKTKPTAKPLSGKENELVTMGTNAVEMIFQLTNRVPGLIAHSHLERTEAWTTYWSPIFRALTTQCVNPCRVVRHQAFSSLQRALLSPQLTSPDHQEWTAIFSEVLFPLISQLLKPEVYHTDPSGMSETRVQAATLLCKIFLHYLVLLSEWDGMLELWLKILDIMDRLMNSGQGDSLEEAVPESLKNILLVMASGDYLVPPSQDPTKAQLWDQTWKRLERFLPGLFAEVIPEPSAPPPDTTPVSAEANPEKTQSAEDEEAKDTNEGS